MTTSDTQAWKAARAALDDDIEVGSCDMSGWLHDFEYACNLLASVMSAWDLDDQGRLDQLARKREDTMLDAMEWLHETPEGTAGLSVIDNVVSWATSTANTPRVTTRAGLTCSLLAALTHQLRPAGCTPLTPLVLAMPWLTVDKERATRGES